MEEKIEEMFAPTAPDEILRTQEGMEASLKKFVDILVKFRPGSMTSTFPAQFVRCNFQDSTMVYKFDTEPGMANPMGALHGGMAASLVDTTMGSLAWYMAGEVFTPTITMKVDYVRTGVIGQPVYVGCRCTRCGRTMCYITCKCWQEDEDYPFITADGVYYSASDIHV